MKNVCNIHQCIIISSIRWSFLTIKQIEGSAKRGEGKDPFPELGIERAEDLCFAVGDVVSLSEEFEYYLILLVVPGHQFLPDAADSLPEIFNDCS
jgi:hypothetical protein